MERIAYPGEAALWDLARREREPAAGRIVPPAASGANGLRSQYPRLVSISAGLESTSYYPTFLLPVEQEPRGGPTDFAEFRQSAETVILALRVVP